MSYFYDDIPDETMDAALVAELRHEITDLAESIAGELIAIRRRLTALEQSTGGDMGHLTPKDNTNTVFVPVSSLSPEYADSGDYRYHGTMHNGEITGLSIDELDGINTTPTYTGTCAERHDAQIAALEERIASLEARLAAIDEEMETWRPGK